VGIKHDDQVIGIPSTTIGLRRIASAAIFSIRERSTSTPFRGQMDFHFFVGWLPVKLNLWRAIRRRFENGLARGLIAWHDDNGPFVIRR